MKKQFSIKSTPFVLYVNQKKERRLLSTKQTKPLKLRTIKSIKTNEKLNFSF